MNPTIQRLLAADPEQKRLILSSLSKDELAVVYRELEAIESSPTRRWYCPRPVCDGTPHAGFHWCDHPIDSENHTPYCKHARTPQRPPSDGDKPWLTWFFSGGRGTGKTRAGAEWVLDLVWNQGYKRIALIGRTPADVRDVMIYGDSGIMSCSDPHPRPTHEPTKRRLVWPNGAQAFTYSAAAPSQLRGPQHDAAWCVAEGELVSTLRGEIPIEQVCVGDQVMTRQGWRTVTAATQTNPNAEVLEIHTEAGQVLRCTPNHKVLANGMWVEAQDVVPSDTLVVWISPLGQQRGLSGAEVAGLYKKTATTKTAQARFYTWLSGKTLQAAVWLQTKLSTTATTTSQTMRQATSLLWTGQNTYATTTPSVGLVSLTLPREQGRKRFGKIASRKMSYASSAVSTISPSVCEPSSVHEPVLTNTCVSAVLRKGQTAAVYDLTVEGAHEFFASEILVHNCDELAAWTDAPKGDVLDTSWNNLMLGLRLGTNPKALVTTTPKRVLLVRQVMERRTTVITTGTTYDNLDNMAASFRENVLAAYEGTRIGEQELMGTLLTDVDGAMWTLEMLENRAELVASVRGEADE